MAKDSQGRTQKNQVWEWTMVGLLLIAAGLFALLGPELEDSALPTVLGLASILAGSIFAATYIRAMIRGRKGRLSLTKVVVPVVLGLLLLIKPAETIKYLLVAAGLFFIVNALFTTIAALVMRAYSKGFFWSLFVIAFLLFTSGLLAILAPTSLGIPVETVIGTGLILNGLLYLMKAVLDLAGQMKGKKGPSARSEVDESPQ